MAIDPLYRRDEPRIVAAYGVRKQLVRCGNPTPADPLLTPEFVRAVDEQVTGNALLCEWIAEGVSASPMGRCRNGQPHGSTCQAADSQAVSNRARVRVS